MKNTRTSTIYDLHVTMLREGKERAERAKAQSELPKLRVAAGYEVPKTYPACQHVAA